MLSSPTVNKGAIIDIVSHFTKHKSLCAATTITLYLYNLAKAFVPTNGSRNTAKTRPEYERSIFFIREGGICQREAAPQQGPSHAHPPRHSKSREALKCKIAQYAISMHITSAPCRHARAQLGQTPITPCIFIKQKATSCDVAFLNSLH